MEGTIIKKELKKHESQSDLQLISLYGYSENSTNDAPDCDPNGSTSNCKC